jgi:hypothetical protein
VTALRSSRDQSQWKLHCEEVAAVVMFRLVTDKLTMGQASCRSDWWTGARLSRTSVSRWGRCRRATALEGLIWSLVEPSNGEPDREPPTPHDGRPILGWIDISGKGVVLIADVALKFSEVDELLHQTSFISIGRGFG